MFPGRTVQDAVSQEIKLSYRQGTWNSMPRQPLVYFEGYSQRIDVQKIQAIET